MLARGTLNSDAHLRPQSAGNFHDRAESRIAALRQRFVEPFAGHANVAGQLAHVLGVRNIVQCGANQTAVARIFLYTRFKVETGIFLGMVCIALSLSNSLLTHLKIDSRRVGRIRACR